VKIPDNSAARITPAVNPNKGSQVRRIKSRVGINGKAWMFDQKGVPSSSREYQLGSLGEGENKASCA
jgi:hypothetical protein